MLTIAEDVEAGNTNSMPGMCINAGESATFPRVPRRSRCPKGLMRKVDWNQLMAKAMEEDKKVQVADVSDSDSDETDNVENRPPLDLTGNSKNELVLDLSKSVESKNVRKNRTMPWDSNFSSYPLRDINNRVKTPAVNRLDPLLESPHEASAKKSLFNCVYERELVTQRHIALSAGAPEYREINKVTEKFEEYGHSNTSGFYSHPYAPPSTQPNLAHTKNIAAPGPSQSSGPQYANIAEPDKFAVPELPQKFKPSTKELVVNGKSYQTLALLGRGGSSKVYLVLAKDNSLLAIKCVNLSNVDDKIRRDHLNEIEHLMKMQYCRHIIKIIDHQYLPGKNLLYAVMERGDTDLSRILKERTTSGEGVPPEMVLFYWSEMLLAVKSIHDNNIIHRDLKPANFLLVGGRLKLIDFGIASGIESEATSVFKESQSGTPNYMSPEAWEDLGIGDERVVKIGRKTDVWSLGCILYTFLYGKTPFQEFSKPMAKIRAITNPNHRIPFPKVKGIPNMLIESCRRCLIYDKNKRASIEELLMMKSQILMTPQEVVMKLRSGLDDESLKRVRDILNDNDVE